MLWQALSCGQAGVPAPAGSTQAQHGLQQQAAQGPAARLGQGDELQPQLAPRAPRVHRRPLVPHALHPLVAAGRASGRGRQAGGQAGEVGQSRCGSSTALWMHRAHLHALVALWQAGASSPARLAALSTPAVPQAVPHGPGQHHNGHGEPEGGLPLGHPVGGILLPARQKICLQLLLRSWLRSQGCSNEACRLRPREPGGHPLVCRLTAAPPPPPSSAQTARTARTAPAPAAVWQHTCRAFVGPVSRLSAGQWPGCAQPDDSAEAPLQARKSMPAAARRPGSAPPPRHPDPPWSGLPGEESEQLVHAAGGWAAAECHAGCRAPRLARCCRRRRHRPAAAAAALQATHAGCAGCAGSAEPTQGGHKRVEGAVQQLLHARDGACAGGAGGGQGGWLDRPAAALRSSAVITMQARVHHR